MTEERELKGTVMETEQTKDEAMEVDSICSDFQVYRLLASEDGQYSTLLQANKVTSTSTGQNSANTFNLLMADVSYSMVQAWPAVIDSWNKHIKDKLIGKKI